MSDIFISYASADRERARLFAEALADAGWSVWWDRAIPPGKQFDEVIEEALDAARCVVVLWSNASAGSTWVKTEAAEAMRRKALIPAVIEEVKIPLEFRRLQAADLSRWQGDRADPMWVHFLASIEAELRGSGQHTGAGARPAPSTPPPQSPQSLQSEPARPVPPVSPMPTPKRRMSPVTIGAIAILAIGVLGGGIYYERARSIAAAEQVAREEAGREGAAREQRAREEAAQREAKGGPSGPRTAPTRAQAGVPASGVMNLQWRDHALGFSGELSWSPSRSTLRAAVVDLQTGAPIGNYSVPARIDQQGPADYAVSAEFAVPGDSATPGPHTHTSRLLVRAQQDGSLRFLRNCPRQGECY